MFSKKKKSDMFDSEQYIKKMRKSEEKQKKDEVKKEIIDDVDKTKKDFDEKKQKIYNNIVQRKNKSKASLLSLIGIKFGLVFYFTAFVSALLIIVLLSTGTKEVLQKISNEINDCCIAKDDRIETLIKEFDAGIQNDFVVNIDDSYIGHNEIRDKAVNRLDEVDTVYYLCPHFEMVGIDKTAQYKVQKENEIYRYLYAITLKDIKTNTSKWIYDINKKKYVRIFSYITKDKFGNYKNTLGFEASGNATNGVIQLYGNVLKNMNIFLVNEEGIIVYKNNKNVDAEKRVMDYDEKTKEIEYTSVNKASLATSVKDDEHIKDETLEKKDVKINSSIQETKNSYDGLIENIFGQLYELIQKININKIFAGHVSSYREKNKFTIIIEYSDYIISLYRDLFTYVGVVVIITLLLSYTLTINIKSKYENLRKIGIIYIISTIAIFVGLTLMYFTSFSQTRKKDILSNGLTINSNIKTNVKTEEIIEDYIEVIKKSDSSNEIIKLLGELEIDIVENYSSYKNIKCEAGFNNSNLNLYYDKYNEISKTLKQNKSNSFGKLNSNKDGIILTRIFSIDENNDDKYEALIKLEIEIDINYFELDKLEDNIAPYIYIESNDKMFKIDKDTYSEIEKKEFDLDETYSDNISFKKAIFNYIVKVNDSELNANYIFVYPFTFTLNEYIIFIIIILINLFEIGFVVRKVHKEKDSFYYENIDNLESTIYGDVVYMQQNELDKSINTAMKKEYAKTIDEMAINDVSIEINKRRKEKQKILFSHENVNDDEDITKVNKNSFKYLSLFKNKKSIYSDYSELQREETKRVNERRIANKIEEREDEEEKEIQSKTLGEALLELQNKKANKIAQIKKEDTGVLNSSKDEEFNEILSNKLKNDKK